VRGRLRFLAATVALASAACRGNDVRLGPADGRDLPPVDTGRVAVGEPAPDFSLRSYADGIVTLSDFRGRQDVVLVFYRGHW
jgi:hypothetical protein